MKQILNTIIAICLSLCVGCASIQVEESRPIVVKEKGNNVSIIRSLPKELPEQSAAIPESQYVMIQTKGGSVFLGGIIGSLNIAANTEKLAQRYKDQYMKVDPYEIVRNVGADSPFVTESEGTFNLNPFVFVQECYDDKFRLSLVFHLKSKDWVGRYTYHLPTAYATNEFGKPTQKNIENYENELRDGAKELFKLIARDLNGQLKSSGKKVDFGSLHIIGSKLGGMGFYTMPEELHFPDTELVEEGDDFVIVRRKGNVYRTVMASGLVFGVHYFKKELLHTYKHM